MQSRSARIGSTAINWTWLLPLIVVGITAVLLSYAPLQDRAFFTGNPLSRSHLTSHYAPAWTAAVLLNGPIFLLFGAIVEGFYGRAAGMAASLPIAAIFWLVVGWTIERRKRGITTPLLKQRWLNATMQSQMLLVSALILVGFILIEIQKLSWAFTNPIQSFQLFGLRSPLILAVGIDIWLVASTLYFGRNLWRMFLSPGNRS